MTNAPVGVADLTWMPGLTNEDLREAADRLVLDRCDVPAGSVLRTFSRSVRTALLDGFLTSEVVAEAERRAGSCWPSGRPRAVAPACATGPVCAPLRCPGRGGRDDRPRPSTHPEPRRPGHRACLVEALASPVRRARSPPRLCRGATPADRGGT